MKKLKLFLLMFLLVLTAPIVFGCNEETYIQLSTPTILEVINEQETGRKLLITDENTYASGYAFGICEMEKHKDDLSKFVRYETTKNYLDVQEIFTQAKTYYFYVQALGEGEYKHSTYSEVKQFSNEFQLSTPVLTTQNNVINWTPVKYVGNYQVYLNNEVLCNTSETSLNLNTYNDGAYLTTNAALNFQVKAVAPANTTYVSSPLSNSVRITAHLTPKTPTISINGSTISWNLLANVESFEFIVTGIGEQTYTLAKNTTSVNLKNFKDIDSNTYINLVEELGEYSIKIKALGKYENSEYSNSVTYKTTTQLSAPQLVSATKDSTKNTLNIKLKVTDENVKAVSLTIKKSGSEIYSTTLPIENVKEFTLSLTLTDLNLSSFSEVTNLTISAYSVNNGDYYLKSNTKTLTVN